MTDDPITPEEMRAMFGETMPIEAIQLVFNAGPDETVGEVRAKLRALAKQKPASPDDYTPARLRELAQRHEQNAADLREYEETCRAAGSWRDDQEQMITPESEEETAAALRAAADRIVSLEHQSNATQIAYQTAAQHLADALNEAERLTATLAARKALLKRAGEQAREFADCYDWWTKDEYGNDRRWLPECVEEARALAAEIAAALKENDND